LALAPHERRRAPSPHEGDVSGKESETVYLKIGDWNIHASGIHGTLRIQEIDELGRLFGTVCDEPITGWWSERARRLTFVRERPEGGGADEQAFKGYAWDERMKDGLSLGYCLAGSYDAFGGRGRRQGQAELRPVRDSLAIQSLSGERWRGFSCLGIKDDEHAAQSTAEVGSSAIAS
jgi:hypothetical protein